MNARPLIAIMGPTAAGKTALAIEAVERHGGEIISVDSAQVYRGLNVGAAKPSSDERARAPHRLIDIREPWERYNAAAFRDDALAAIEELEATGSQPWLAGGTMLYFRALFEGLSPLPAADRSLRAELEAEAQRHGWGRLHEELERVDPVAAARIHPNDPQRLQRALEVWRLTGRPLTELLAARSDRADRPVRRLIVCPADRAVLHEQIRRRRDAMFAAGLVAEVRGLMEQSWFDPELPAMRAVGYRQVLAYLSGSGDLDGARDRVLYATRQLAKRQLTWLRREPDGCWIDPTSRRDRERARELLSRWQDEVVW